MREVIPAIENCWQAAAPLARIINVDEEPLRDHLAFLLECDALIVVAFNETISRFIVNIRSNLNIQIPLVLHLYGHATLGCWPQQRFGTLENLNEGDAFIGTCEGDLKCMKHSFENAKTYNIPYPYFSLSEEWKSVKGEKVLSYVGRISDQKNIDLLIKAYKQLVGINLLAPPLYIFGSEDFLGSPNMGIPSTRCLEELVKLVDSLNLSKSVFFKGYFAREEIYKILGSEHIFVSASTHSDENFGMAAMRSLAVGGKAVLSHWGGHQIFRSEHPDRVWTSKVFFENDRPVIDPYDFACRMNDALSSSDTHRQSSLSDYFMPDSVVNNFKKVLKELRYSKNKLVLTEISRRVHRQQSQFEKDGNVQKAFIDYADPLAQLYLGAYR